MKTKVRLVLMSHLSDISYVPGDTKNNHLRAEFCKWLLLRYPDTSQEIDPDDEYDKFLTKDLSTSD